MPLLSPHVLDNGPILRDLKSRGRTPRDELPHLVGGQSTRGRPIWHFRKHGAFVEQVDPVRLLVGPRQPRQAHCNSGPPAPNLCFFGLVLAGGVGWGGEGGEGAHDDVSSRAEAPIIKGCCASVLRWVLRSIVLVRHPLAVCQLVVEAKQTGGPLSFWLHLTRRFARHSCRQSLDLIASRLGDTAEALAAAVVAPLPDRSATGD